VWKLLGAVKGQLGQFHDLLEKVGRKLEEASNTVGAATRKSRHIHRRLGQVESLPADEAAALLPAGPDE
jgi:DNA recombination protein RmuC